MIAVNLSFYYAATIPGLYATLIALLPIQGGFFVILYAQLNKLYGPANGGQAFAYECTSTNFQAYVILFVSLVIQRNWGFQAAIITIAVFPIIAIIAVFFIKDEVAGLTKVEEEEKGLVLVQNRDSETTSELYE